MASIFHPYHVNSWALTRKNFWNQSAGVSFCSAADQFLINIDFSSLQSGSLMMAPLNRLLGPSSLIPVVRQEVLVMGFSSPSYLPITYFFLSQSFWNFAQSMAVVLPCFLQKWLGKMNRCYGRIFLNRLLGPSSLIPVCWGRAWQWYCCALCKISKWSGNWHGYYWRIPLKSQFGDAGSSH